MQSQSCVDSINLNNDPILIHSQMVNLILLLGDWFGCYPCFTDEESEAHRGH